MIGPACEYLDAQPFRYFVDGLCRTGWSRRDVAKAAGLPEQRLWNLLSGRQDRVHVDVVDRLAIATGGHLDEVYPYEEAAA